MPGRRISSLGASLWAGSFTVLLVAACGGDGGGTTPPDPRASCNPLAGESDKGCLSPFPSAAYMVADASSQTGFRLSFPEGALPVNVDGKRIDHTYYDRWDGFSPNAPIIVHFVGGVDESLLPPHTDPARSVAADSPIVLLDMDTGERQLFFAELDHVSDDDEDRALIIRPLKRMPAGHRIAVAVRKSLKSASGGELPIAPAFQAALDGAEFEHALWERIAPRMPEVFTKLEAAGVAKTDLVLAWDFVTASDEFLTSDLRSMVEQALPVMGTDGTGLSYTIAPIAGLVNDNVLFAAHGTYEAPMFLSNGEDDDSHIVRDETTGLPVLQAQKHSFNWAILIPRCAETAVEPLPIMVFGHGLFGSADDYVDGGLLQRVANENCVAVIAGDWIGLTERNIASVALGINDLNKGRYIPEKLSQGVINFMTLARIVRGPLGDDEMLKVGGQRVLDPTRVWYFGASLGGIMGGTFMSYEPDVELGVLGVPGCNWTICFERSLAWPPLQIALQNAYPGFVINEEIIVLMGMAFDRVDPVTTAPNLLAGGGVVGAPAKKIWFYYAMADSLVSNIASEMMARTLGLEVTGPSLRVPFGLTERMSPGASGVTVFDEKREPVPSLHNLAPAEDNGTHADIHERPAVISMIRHFFEQGEVVHACATGGSAAPCDCTTGACEGEAP